MPVLSSPIWTRWAMPNACASPTGRMTTSRFRCNALADDGALSAATTKVNSTRITRKDRFMRNLLPTQSVRNQTV